MEDLQNEIWKDIDYRYSVSNMGRVRSNRCEFYTKNNKKLTKKEKILSTKGLINGYPVVNILINGRRKAYKVHQLVIRNFIENTKNLRCINHINGIKTDNRLENLEYCSHSDNIKHSYKYLNRPLSKAFNERNYNSRKVINIITGEIFPSAIQVIRDNKINIKPSSFGEMLRGRSKNKTDFKYVE